MNNDKLEHAAETLCVLSDGFSVNKEFYDSVLLQVKEIIPAISPGERYTAEMLCGEDFWENLSPKEAQTAGKCLADLVRKGALPLQMTGCEHQSPRRYMKY